MSGDFSNGLGSSYNYGALNGGGGAPGGNPAPIYSYGNGDVATVASTTSNEASTSASATKKGLPKKRKSVGASGSGDDAEGEEEQKKKRIKTPRACDICRRSKRR